MISRICYRLPKPVISQIQNLKQNSVQNSVQKLINNKSMEIKDNQKDFKKELLFRFSKVIYEEKFNKHDFSIKEKMFISKNQC